jgi:apolipoprotein N-acyltransferase
MLNAGYGRYRLGQDLDRRDTHLETAVIQGNIDQAVKWDPDFQEATVDIYRGLSRQAVESGAADLLIWPEAATPFYFQRGGVLADRVSELPRATGAHLLFGSPAYLGEPGDYQSLNSAFLLSHEGAVLGRSDKVHLVPFGEYVPLKPFLPFIDKLVVGIGDYSPGQVKPLGMNGYDMGVLVCYEAIFPELARNYVSSGSDLLVNITNDAWFGRSSAPAQHLAMVRFRAIENRVWIARAANTGISAFISPSGRIVNATNLFETTYATASVGLGARPGLYARTGDLVPGVFLLVVLIWLIQTRKRQC